MITVQLNGGLGNQMFQYALGRTLAIKNGTGLRLDISRYSSGGGITPRNFELTNYAIKAEISSMVESNNKIRTRFDRLLPYYKRSIVYEKDFGFDSNILNCRKSCTLIGYWQSEKYFKSIESIVRQDFQLIEKLPETLQKTAELIRFSNSVSLHFRRGDYAQNIEVNKIHGLCSLDYYSSAIDLLTRKLPDLKLFIFSDDLSWVSKNFKPGINIEVNYIQHSEKNVFDLHLMSLCKHHIIANSSFSWWGAWLSNSLEKTIIAPQSWFKTITRNTSDLIPSSWIKI